MVEISVVPRHFAPLDLGRFQVSKRAKNLEQP